MRASRPLELGGTLSTWGPASEQAPGPHGGAPWRWWGRNPNPELEELAPDAHVAPPGVLPPQAEDQLPDLGGRGQCVPEGGVVHFLLASCRCHRSRVSGPIRNASHDS